MDKRNVVFFTRIKPKSKKALVAAMIADGYDNMSVWFDKYVEKTFSQKRKKRVSKKS